ncbi:MAG TPA: glucan 1,4-alpha-glucosidase [Pirellulales bacterium]|nr:glucan 1,4-alpha-glucosidase [Pirellulales bacterium]
MSETHSAPGRPGLPPRWTSSAKQGVGTALSNASPLWFTLSHGIVNEVYYPRVDLACTRDMGLIVTDGGRFFSEEKRDARSRVEYLAEGVPAYRITNACMQGRYVIEKEIFSDPRRPVLLQHVHFRPQVGELDAYQLFLLASPHLGNQGSDNTAWVGDYKGVPLLFAGQNGIGMAIACSAPWLARSVGFVGVSDGWQDLSHHGRLTWQYERAEHGNVALTGQINLAACHGDFVLAVGFGQTVHEAAHRVVSSVLEGIEPARHSYVREWRHWQEALLPLDSEPTSAIRPARPRPNGERQTEQNVYRVSTAVIHTHEAKNFPGGLVASLSIPWGFSKGDNDLGGYHLVWPRDLVESAGGLMAAGAKAIACRVLRYLQVTQEADGHWGQNMWLDGTAYWDGIQMDEAALPVLLVDLARRQGMLDDGERAALWPMVRHAAGYLVRNGPATQQDRWEEDPGYSPFTLAAEIAALLVAAEMADEQGEFHVAQYLRETADFWHSSLDDWIYATDTELARRLGVDGYYVRIAPETDGMQRPVKGYVVVKNRPSDVAIEQAGDLVSPDALALVRFGLRAADDPRMVNTVKVIDGVLKVDLPNGPCWYRYNRDGYGEHADGGPFDGTGIGRPWPLLTGERAHYELAAGRRHEAERLLAALEQFANCGGLFPEQVWDGDDLPDRELFRGEPAGSAMPLVWAHAEHIKLLRSLRDGKVFDMPPQTVERYLVQKKESPHCAWRFNHRCHQMAAGKILRIEVLSPAMIRWSCDDWNTTHEINTCNTELGLHMADLPTCGLAAGASVVFTFFWPEAAKWEGTDFRIHVAERAPAGPTTGAA